MKKFFTLRSHRQAAFTRIEALTLIATLGLLLAVILPALANTGPRSARVICMNNLRQIGIGMQLWGNDHGNEPPHHVLYRDGGTKQHPLAANAWLHFSWISNEVSTPKIFFCPSDTGTAAGDFSGSSTMGYVHPNFGNRATSYLLAFSYSADDHRIQSSDRNVYSAGVLSSSYFNFAAYVRMNPLDPAFRWMPGLHGDFGNVLFSDGQVAQADTARLRAAAERGADFLAGAHNWRFCLPR
jgi:competence protein ComGC